MFDCNTEKCKLLCFLLTSYIKYIVERKTTTPMGRDPAPSPSGWCAERISQRRLQSWTLAALRCNERFTDRKEMEPDLTGVDIIHYTLAVLHCVSTGSVETRVSWSRAAAAKKRLTYRSKMPRVAFTKVVSLRARLRSRWQEVFQSPTQDTGLHREFLTRLYFVLLSECKVSLSVPGREYHMEIPVSGLSTTSPTGRRGLAILTLTSSAWNRRSPGHIGI